ncbi:M24 family metallopeptidase, partial [Chloroflexota bacterium]
MSYVVNRNVDKARYGYFRFSDDEYARRHRKIRQFMTEHDLGCLLITGQGAIWDRCWSNITYVMNWMGTMEFPAYCVFPIEGEPIVTCLDLNASFPDRVARITVGEARGRMDTVGLAAECIQEFNLQSSRIGLVGPDVMASIPANHLKTLTETLPHAEFIDVTEGWWLMRLAKSPEELAAIELAAYWGDLINIELSKLIKPGITERELFSMSYSIAFKLGADYPSMLLIGTAPMDRPFGSFPRNKPVDRILQRGDVVITELGPRHPGGYEAQVGHIFTLGPATSLYKELFAKAVESHDRIRDVLLPGNTEMNIWEAGHSFHEENYDAELPRTSNSAHVHGMFAVPRDFQQKRVVYEKPIDTNPLVPYQVIAIEVRATTSDRTGSGPYIVKPYVVMPAGPPKALSQLPLEIAEL